MVANPNVLYESFAQPARRALALSLLCLGSALGCCACGSSGTPSARPNPRRWLAIDTTARRATITLVASYDGSAFRLNLDGAVKGALLFQAPTGWRVSVRCVNNASVARYSCALLNAPGTGGVGLPEIAGSQGPVSPGDESRFSFLARTKAAYRLVALLDGRPVSGMWVALDVVPSARPSALWLR